MTSDDGGGLAPAAAIESEATIERIEPERLADRQGWFILEVAEMTTLNSSGRKAADLSTTEPRFTGAALM